MGGGTNIAGPFTKRQREKLMKDKALRWERESTGEATRREIGGHQSQDLP